MDYSMSYQCLHFEEYGSEASNTYIQSDILAVADENEIRKRYNVVL